MLEIKDAAKSFTLSLSYITRLFKTAIRQNKEPLLIVKFPGYTLDIKIRRNERE